MRMGNGSRNFSRKLGPAHWGWGMDPEIFLIAEISNTSIKNLTKIVVKRHWTLTKKIYKFYLLRLPELLFFLTWMVRALAIQPSRMSMTPALFGSNWGRSFSSPACKHSLDLVKNMKKHSRSEFHISNHGVCLLHGLVIKTGYSVCV